MKPRLQIRVVRRPHPNAEREIDQALDVIAEAIADRLIARARRDVARERGVAEEAIDREHERVAEAAWALSPIVVRAGDRAW